MTWYLVIAIISYAYPHPEDLRLPYGMTEADCKIVAEGINDTSGHYVIIRAHCERGSV